MIEVIVVIAVVFVDDTQHTPTHPTPQHPPPPPHHTAQGLLFFLYNFSFKAGGALSALVLGLVANLLWQQGRNLIWPLHKFIPSLLSSGPNEKHSHQVEHVIGIYWRWVAQPLLFGIIGTMMNFRKPGFVFSYIPKALAIIAVGLAVRMPTTFVCMAKAGLTWKERLFVAFAWTPKVGACGWGGVGGNGVHA